MPDGKSIMCEIYGRRENNDTKSLLAFDTSAQRIDNFEKGKLLRGCFPFASTILIELVYSREEGEVSFTIYGT